MFISQKIVPSILLGVDGGERISKKKCNIGYTYGNTIFLGVSRGHRDLDGRARRVFLGLEQIYTQGLMASDKNYTTVFMVDQTPGEAFAAINNVRGWWSGDIEGDTDKLGAEWTYRYKDIHYSKQKITELIPGKKVVWQVLDGYLNFVKEKKEWAGTKIMFEIAPKGGKTEVRFTHVGLAPNVECYGVCSDAWGFYINDSLRNFIATGKGQPNEK
jgi:hypothetical protein